MKATEFAKWFDFTISLNTENEPDEFGDITKYIVEDDERVFCTRYIDSVWGLADCFDSMLMDYIESPIEERGFDYDINADGTFYEQALKWAKANKDKVYSEYIEMLECIVDPDLIEDDVA